MGMGHEAGRHEEKGAGGGADYAGQDELAGEGGGQGAGGAGNERCTAGAGEQVHGEGAEDSQRRDRDQEPEQRTSSAARGRDADQREGQGGGRQNAAEDVGQVDGGARLAQGGVVEDGHRYRDRGGQEALKLAWQADGLDQHAGGHGHFDGQGGSGNGKQVAAAAQDEH